MNDQSFHISFIPCSRYFTRKLIPSPKFYYHTMDSADAVNGAVDSPAPPRSGTSTKGFGLKKWRRIPRNNINNNQLRTVAAKEIDNDRDSDSDSTAARMLKRGPANIVNENEPPLHLQAKSTIPSPKCDELSSINPTFSAGAGDSDYSEDSHSHRGSSNSSTAASFKYGYRASSSHHHHHHHARKNSSQRLGLSKSQTDPGKKAKDGSKKLGFDKETSPISSFESDSRSCNSVFVPPRAPGLLPTSPPLCEQKSVEEEQSQADTSDQLSSSVNKGNCKDDDHDRDPFVDSMLLLQSAQLALQAELQKFGEIGKGISSLYDDSDKTSGVEVDAVVHMANGLMCDGCNGNDKLSNSVQSLERQLNKAECSLKEKELRIAEIETTLRSMESHEDHVKSAMEQQFKRCTEMEAELHVLFRQKLEAEVLSVLMTRSSKDLSVLVEDYSLLAKDKARMADVEKKDESDTLYTGEEIQEMHRGVNKLTKCFVIQFLLLFVVITLFVFQLAPKSAVVAPT